MAICGALSNLTKETLVQWVVIVRASLLNCEMLQNRSPEEIGIFPLAGIWIYLSQTAAMNGPKIFMDKIITFHTFPSMYIRNSDHDEHQKTE